MIMKGGKTVSWLLALTVAIGTFTGTAASAKTTNPSETEDGPQAQLEKHITLPSGENDWVSDRTEPEWEINDNNIISLTTKAEPNGETTDKDEDGYNYYAWQGIKTSGDVMEDLASHWKVETEIQLPNQSSTDGENQSSSVWLDVQDENGNVDWAILQFNKKAGSDGWQWWESPKSGKWNDIEKSATPGWHKLAIEFDAGTITEFIDGKKVNSYEVKEENSSEDKEENASEPVTATKTKVQGIYFNSYSYGQEYTAQWKVPTVSVWEDYEQLSDAIEAAEEGDTVKLLSDVEDLSTIIISHPITIDGNGKTLKFDAKKLENEGYTVNDPLILWSDSKETVTVKDLTVDVVGLPPFTSPTDWKGIYGIQVYNTTAILENVKTTGGNAGIEVNGSNVTLKGIIDVSGNDIGGIEVSQGEDVSEDSQLTIDEDAELKNSSESATNPTAWLISTKDGNGADVFQGKITDEGRHFAVTNRVAKSESEVQTQYFLTAGNAPLAPAEGWNGPAGKPGTIYAKDSQTFTFSFKESNVVKDIVKKKLEKAGKEVAPVLRLTIYLNGERGTGDTPDDSYDDSVKIPLPPVSGSSVPAETIEGAITDGLGKIADDQTQEKTNTIELLEAAGVIFNKDENGQVSSVGSVDNFRKNISYQDGTWTVRLNTKKLLSDHISKIEFLVKPSLNLTAEKTEENPFGISDTKVLQLGNNNYFKQETLGLTQAYLYTIAEPETVTAVSPLPSSVKTQWVKKDSAPSLPRTLTVNGGTAVSGVTWTSSPAYNSAKTGTYTFTPVLPEGYELGEGVTLPTITVKVYKPSDDDNDDDDKEENKPLNPVIPAPTPSGSFVSDTTRDFSVNGTYQFRITSKDGKEPTFVIGTPGVFEIQSVTRSGNDYFFKLRAIGAPGDKAGLYVNNGPRLLVATVGSNPNYAKLDTGKQLPVKAGRTYQFRVTAAKKPTFVCGTGSAFRVAYAGSRGNDYFFKVTATGKPGDKAGFYLNGEKAPRTIGTIVA